MGRKRQGREDFESTDLISKDRGCTNTHVVLWQCPQEHETNSKQVQLFPTFIHCYEGKGGGEEWREGGGGDEKGRKGGEGEEGRSGRREGEEMRRGGWKGEEEGRSGRREGVEEGRG